MTTTLLRKKNGIEMAGLIGNDGLFKADVPFFAGKGVFESNDLVVAKLQEVGAMLKFSKIKHSYPHCWRHKNPNYLPRHTTMVYRHGKTRLTPTSLK
ncbi:Isoleucyl-tRNA synthase [Pasteurella multocida]|nr:Isoleucyl-tRNA synthase [Pasteurella multocida]